MYLKDRTTEIDKETGRDKHGDEDRMVYPLVYSLKCMEQLGLGQTDARSKEVHPRMHLQKCGLEIE